MWIAIAVIALLVPPLAGVVWTGAPLEPYWQFPPRPEPRDHAAFSWAVFLVLACIITAAIVPLLGIGMRRYRHVPTTTALPLPPWGWLGIALLGASWCLAWTRYPWFAPWQAHTFTPLWLGYIVTLNALTYRRSARSLLTHRPGYLLGLFPLSAVFWWYFEYLNRFAGNWHYAGIEAFSALEYVLFASLSFATVLPAVMSTHAWLETFPALSAAFAGLPPLRPRSARSLATPVLMIAVMALAALARYPDQLYPLVWIAPLLVVTAVRAQCGLATVFAPLAHGDYRVFALTPLAALICGAFWEMWNWQSLTHWEYDIAYVDRFHLFAMPLLGYAGYLPFGLECVAIAQLLPSASLRDPDGA